MTNIKIGNKVKVITQNHTHQNIIFGKSYKVVGVHQNGTHFSLECAPSYWLMEHEVELLPLSKEELQKSLVDADEKIVEANKEKEAIKSKIAYLDETGATEFDETEYKVYKTLQTVNSTASDIEKAKLIASLING